MSLKVWELGIVKLEDLTEKLILVANATAELRIENPCHQLGSTWTKGIFESGNLWVTRAAGLCLNVEIHIDGKPMDKSCCLPILESVAYGISNAKFWSALCLSTVVEFSPESHPSHFSVKINDSTSQAESSPDQSSLPVWLQPTGLIQPSSVIPAKLEKIYLKCNFTSRSTPKRRKAEPLRASQLDVMLLDHRTKSTLDKTNTVAGLNKVLPLQPSSKSGFDLSRGSHLIRRDSTQNTNTTKPQGTRFPKHIANILKDWVAANTGKAHPDEHDRITLTKETGLHWRQITNSIRYYKEREQKTRASIEDDMLLETDCSTSLHKSQTSPELLDVVDEAPGDTEMLLIDDVTEFDVLDEDFDMLFGMNALPTPALTEASSSQSSDGLSNLSGLKRVGMTDMNETSGIRNLGIRDCMVTSKLVDIALRTLIGGHFYCQPKQIVLNKKESLDLPLQSISPSLFSLGFRQAMTRNSKFVPVISRSISTSIFCRAQSPALREKLSELWQVAASDMLYSLEHRHSDLGQSLFAVVQSRLWAMMQRTHFDPSRARRLLHTESGDSLLNENADFEDLLQDQAAIDDAEDDDSDSDFDDLLDDDDDDGFLDYLDEAERERLCSEREIEEMLLGHEQDVEDDSLLFLDAIEEDSLLL